MKLLNYFSPEAKARRQRANERFNLAAELREITVSRRYYDAREPRILLLLAALDRQDAIASGELVELKVGAYSFTIHGAKSAKFALPTSRIVEDDACLGGVK